MKTRIENLSNDRRRLFEARFQQEIASLPLGTVPIIPRTWDVPIPLTRSQERLWRIEQRHPGLAVFNNPTRAILDGPLDAGALARALASCAERHEGLRTRIRSGRYPEQHVAPPAPVELPIVDLSHLPEAEALAEAGARCAASAARVFELEDAPLERAELFRIAPNRHLLFLNWHHIIIDGWSGAILADELPRLYEAHRDGREPGLAELPIRIADHAIWQRQWISGEAAKRQLGYWQRQLGGDIRPLPLGPGCGQPRVHFTGAAEATFLPLAMHTALGACARQHKVTAFVLALALFQELLRDLTGQDDIIVGTPTAGRIRPETEAICGYFVNKLALRSNLAGNPSRAELIQRVNRTFLDALEHQDVPFLDVLEAVAPARAADHAPIYNTQFTLSHLAPRADDAAIPGVTWDWAPVDTGGAEFDLSVSMHPRAEGLEVKFLYATEALDAAAVRSMLTRFVALLEDTLAPHVV